MNGMIKVTTEKLTNTANAFDSTGNEIKNITNEMMNLITSISGAVWSGEAAAAYKNKFSSLQGDINRIVKMVNEHVTDLHAMVKEYETAETGNIQVSGTLQSDIIH